MFWGCGKVTDLGFPFAMYSVCVCGHAHTFKTSPGSVPGAFLRTAGGSTRGILLPNHRVQAESRAGSNKPFIHSFIPSVILSSHRKDPQRNVPTGPRHSASF